MCIAKKQSSIHFPLIHESRLSIDVSKRNREEQHKIIVCVVRSYNATVPIIQNLDFGHGDPQIALLYGTKVRVDKVNKKIFAEPAT